MSAFLSESTELIAFVPDGAPQSSDFLSFERFSEMQAEAHPATLTGDRLLGAQAMRLLMRLDRQLLEARAQWNQDCFAELCAPGPRPYYDSKDAGRALIRRRLFRWV